MSVVQTRTSNIALDSERESDSERTGQAFRLVLLLIISIGIYGITKILDYKGCLVITFMVLVMPYLLFKLGINSMKYLSVEILMDFGRIIGKY